MKKDQDKEILSLFAGVDLKSIYYPLRVLGKKGLVAHRRHKKRQASATARCITLPQARRALRNY